MPLYIDLAQRSNDETFHLTEYSIVSKQTNKKLAQGHAARVAFVEGIKFVSTLNKSYFQRIIQVFLYPEVLQRFVVNSYSINFNRGIIVSISSSL